MPDVSAPFALVVDDDAMILMSACDMLEEAGFRPLEAMNVAEAIGEMEDHGGDITLLFTDVDMPGDRDGFDLANEVAERWPNTKILIASGAREPKADQIPRDAVFVRKPFSAEIIYQRLHELLPDGQKPEPLKAKHAP
jgi:CheY-like chemotaxis protein